MLSGEAEQISGAGHMAINGFHAHVYFDESTFSQAAALCQAAHQHFDIPMGHMHRKPVGPHPFWSCQLSIPRRLAGDVIPWLMASRNGLTVFVHGLSGDDLRDHTELVMWLGESLPLDLSIFQFSA
jgi:DOPA 4,5-dioxygenase|tara:strand:- start:6509 stop:6886 length:378 start_codon:yes stop_codon:yes gene_type:complete